MSIAAAGVLRRAALNAFRLNSFRAAPGAAPARTLSAGPKKPAAELTFKEAWLSDPATYPIVVIISSPYPASLRSTPRPKKHVPLPRPVRPGRRRVVGEHERGRAQRPKGPPRAYGSRAAHWAGRATFIYHTAAVIGCFSYCTFCLFCSPDVRITKTARSQVIRDWT